MPWVSTGEPAGSTPTKAMSGFFSRRKRPVPVKVPPVPIPATKASSAPPACSHSSGPVDS